MSKEVPNNIPLLISVNIEIAGASKINLSICNVGAAKLAINPPSENPNKITLAFG